MDLAYRRRGVGHLQINPGRQTWLPSKADWTRATVWLALGMAMATGTFFVTDLRRFLLLVVTTIGAVLPVLIGRMNKPLAKVLAILLLVLQFAWVDYSFDALAFFLIPLFTAFLALATATGGTGNGAGEE